MANFTNTLLFGIYLFIVTIAFTFGNKLDKVNDNLEKIIQLMEKVQK